jgi:hypothetical protein
MWCSSFSSRASQLLLARNEAQTGFESERRKSMTPANGQLRAIGRCGFPERGVCAGVSQESSRACVSCSDGHGAYRWLRRAQLSYAESTVAPTERRDATTISTHRPFRARVPVAFPPPNHTDHTGLHPLSGPGQCVSTQAVHCISPAATWGPLGWACVQEGSTQCSQMGPNDWKSDGPPGWATRYTPNWSSPRFLDKRDHTFASLKQAA